MKIFDGIGQVPIGFGPSAISIGKFDGVHIGHRAVLDALTDIATRRNLESVAVTFDRNPLALLAPERCPESLVSLRQKIALLAETGVAATLVLRFERELADQSPEGFVEQVILGTLNAKSVLVGADFRFGARGAGDVALLKQLGETNGFEVVVIAGVIPTLESESGGTRRASSTWVRELVAEGDVETAAAILGRLPVVSGVVVHGAARGRELGFPTANLSVESEGLIPADGIYAGWLTDAGVRYPSAISVGDNPTFKDIPEKQVEAYVLDEDLYLYGHEVTVEFAKRIRGQVAFTTIPALIDQIATDVSQTRAVLGIAARRI